MVFESVVADLLNRFLGDYVENLNRSQLKIGIWGGDVVLENLVLKQNALDDLNLPIQTIYGRLGKLVLKIPWKNLYGASVEASIEGLFLLVAPNLQVKYDPEKEDQLAQQSKQAELQRVEDAKNFDKSKLDEKVNDSFYEKLATQIVKNVQLKIKDIHVRYEDRVTNPENPFAFGITLHNLSVQTTDESWKATIVQEAVVKIFKVLTLEGLALYWNPKTPLFANYSKDTLQERFQEEIATKDTTPPSYDYILGPINATAKLKLNPKPEADSPKFSIPKCVVSLDMEQLAIGLTKNQYQDIMMLADSMDMMLKGMPYRKYRPFLTSYRGHYKQWWRFAYDCVLETMVRRRRREWDWRYISEHRSMCKKYAEAYQTKLTCGAKAPPKVVQELLDTCEKNLDLFNLVVIRQKIEMEVDRLGKAEEEAKKNRGWFGSWWGSGSNKNDNQSDSTNIMKQFEKAMTSDEKDKLYRAIGYQENSAPPHMPPAFASLHTEFRLEELLLCIKDGQRRLVARLRLARAILSTTQRPGANAIRVGVCMQEMSVWGVQQKDFIPQLVTSQYEQPGNNLLNVSFETNPLDGCCDQRVVVSAQPLQLVYDAQTVLDLTDVFKLQTDSATLSQLQAVAGNRLSELREVSLLGLQYAVHQHHILDVNIDISSSYLIVPFRGMYTSEGDQKCCVVKFGEVSVKSAPRGDSDVFNVQALHKKGYSEDQILQEAMLHSYDKFILNITDIQAVIANQGEKWHLAIHSGEVSVMHLLLPTSVSIEIHRCLVIDDPRLPKIKVIGSLKELALTASEERLATLLEILTSIPLVDDSNNLSGGKVEDWRGSSHSLASMTAGIGLPNRMAPSAPTVPLPSSQDTDEYAQLTNLDAHFVVNEMILRVNRGGADLASSSHTLLTFALHTMELKVTQKTYNLNVLARLGGVALEHHDAPGIIRLLETPSTQNPEDSYLFYIQYSQVDKASPDFHTRYGSVQQLVVFEFTTLRVLLHLESLQWILRILGEYQARIKLILSEGEKVSTPIPGLAAIREDVEDISLSKSKGVLGGRSEGVVGSDGRHRVAASRSKRRESQTVQLKVRVAMKEVSVSLATQKRPLAELAVCGASAGLLVRDAYTQVNLRLHQITVTDLNPQTIHKQILSIPGGDVLDAQVVLFNLTEFPDVSDCNIKIELRVSCIRIIFLNWFIQSVLAFLNNFQEAQSALAEASAAAADVARANVANAYQTETKVLLRLRVQAPVVMAPESSFSESCALLDLGLITLTNNFQEISVPEQQHKVVLDEMALALENLKASRVRLLPDGTVCDEHEVIEPISFTLHTKRNISSSWYHGIPDLDISGRIKAIKASVSLNDYKMMMRILSLNLSEGAEAAVDDFSPPVSAIPESTAQTAIQADKKKKVSKQDSDEKTVQTELSVIPVVSVKFTFMMEHLSIDLMTTSEIDDTDSGLARLGLVCLSVKGQMLSDGSLHTSILLVDCILDDLRPRRESKISRYLERKTEGHSADGNPTGDKLKSMLDITYTQKKQDIFVDIRVYSFNLILAVDFLLKLSDFGLQGLAAVNENDSNAVAVRPGQPKLISKESITSIKSKKSTTTESSTLTGLMTINFKAEEPDIVLVESLENRRCQALILKAEVWVRLRTVGGRRVAEGGVSSLRLISRHWSTAGPSGDSTTIIRPCNVALAASAHADRGWHADIAISDISIHVSPKTISLLTRVMSTVMSSEENKDEEEEAFNTYTDLWEIKPLQENSAWFLNTEVGLEALEGGNLADTDLSDSSIAEVPQDEICMLACPSITIALDALLGDEELPVLSLQSSMKAQVANWSTKMNLESSWSMEISYYNVSLALWEPFLEPIEVLKDDAYVHIPWEFKIQMLVHKNGSGDDLQSNASLTSSPDEASLISAQPSSTLSLNSEYPLELTFTKTCLEVLNQLSKSFSEAMRPSLEVEVRDEDDQTDNADQLSGAPYIVSNDTGLRVRLLLRAGDDMFMVCARHNTDSEDKQTRESEPEYGEVVLDSGARVALQLRRTHTSSITSSSKSPSILTDRVLPDLRLLIQVVEADCLLSLPVVRADKRFFPLRHSAAPTLERTANANVSAGRLAVAAVSAASAPLTDSRGSQGFTLVNPNDTKGIVSEVAVIEHSIQISLRSIIQVTNYLSEPVEVYYMTMSGNEVESLGLVESNCSMNLPLHAVYTPTGELFFSVKGYSVSVVPMVWRTLQREVRVTRLLQCDAKDRQHNEKFYMKGVGWMEQVYLRDTAKRTLSSACYNIELWPAVVLQNCLPVDVTISPQGMSEVKEHLMKAGETLHLPNVKPGTTNIVIMLSSYLDKCWTAIGTLPLEGTEWTVWTLESHDSTALVTLDLGLNCRQRSGSQHFSLYCPFWMINKTGLMLSYRNHHEESGNVLFHPAKFDQPIMFSFRAKDFFGKKKAAIRVEFGDWSEKFSLDVAGSSGVINCLFDGVLYQVGMTNTLTYNSLTKIITFTPYFLAVNKAPYDVEVQEVDRPGDTWTRVPSRSALALWPRSEREDKLLRVRVRDKPQQTSAPFIYTDQHTTLLRLDNQYGGISVETQVSEGGVSVTLSNYHPGLAPVHIFNHTLHTLTLWEKESVNIRKLRATSSMMFTWGNPTGPRILILEGYKRKEIEYDLRMDGIGDFMVTKDERAYWVSFLDGRQRILLVTCDVVLAHLAHTAGESGAMYSETTVALHSIGLSLVNNAFRREILYVSITSSGAVWEERKASGKRWRKIDEKETGPLEAAWQARSLRLELQKSAGSNVEEPPARVMLDARTEVDLEVMQLLRPRQRDLRRIMEPGAWLSWSSSAHTSRLHAKIHRLQIDQQLPTPMYPVTLAPVPPPRSIAASYDLVKPFAELSIVERIMEHTTIRQYKYWKLLVQEFHVKMDLGLVNALLEMFPQEDITEQQAMTLLQQDLSTALAPLSSASGREAIAEQKNFYDIIHLSPLKVHISFSLGSASVGDTLPVFIGTVLKGIGVTLTEMNDVVFKLAFYERTYEFMSQKELMSTVTHHYTGQAIKQLYVLVLGLDVIGNPYGLAIGIKKGVEDLFYEPFQGAIQGPSEFAEGLMLGVRSLVGHTLGGAAGAMSRITGAMGRGLATISGDEDFQRKRNDALSKPPANLRQGLARSGKGLVMGVVDGVTGVFTKPISGAREQGMEGFFKGLGKGAVGLVARPTAGVVDFASGSLDAVKRAAENLEEVARRRPPRWLMADRLVRPYSKQQAEGYRMIREFDKGKYMATDTYETHQWIVPNKEVLLLTDQRLIYLEKSAVFGGWQMVWTFLWEDVPEPPRVVDKGVFLPTNESRKKVLGLFATQTAGKLILVSDEQHKKYLVSQCRRLMEAHR